MRSSPAIARSVPPRIRDGRRSPGAAIMAGHDRLTMLTATICRPRRPTTDDAEACGRIFYDAFASIAAPPQPRRSSRVRRSSRTSTSARCCAATASPGWSPSATGRWLGSRFVDERGPIAGIGPVIVDPGGQDDGVGRALMEAVVLERTRGAAGIRLVQTAYHYRSLALYAKLGFVVREPLSVLQGPRRVSGRPGLGVRPARAERRRRLRRAVQRVHGHDRSGELRDAIAAGTALRRRAAGSDLAATRPASATAGTRSPRPTRT